MFQGSKKLNCQFLIYNALLNYLCCVIRPLAISTPQALLLAVVFVLKRVSHSYLLVLVTQNPKVDKFMWLLNLNGNTFGTECSPVVSHSGACYFNLHGRISVARRALFEHTM